MPKTNILSSLSVRLTLAFLLASILGIVLVAALAYRSTSSEFNDFLSRLEAMDRMMGGGMGMTGGMMGSQTFIQAQSDFLSNLGRSLWLAGFFGAALAIFLGYLFTRQIVAPLDEVASAAGRVARGDLEHRVSVSGTSEIARLGESFNAMASTLSRDKLMRQNMVADIAHELRTPLSILQGNIEAMQDGVIEPNPENLASIHQETLLLARLVEDLRTLSLADSGQLTFHPAETDLKALAVQVLNSFESQMADKRISSSLEAPSELPSIRTDADRTAQALRNLLANALHFTPDGGKITARLVKDNAGITVSVLDTGIGISAEELPRVFERFYRVDRSRSRATGGSGLGLAIVKQLIEAQGGRVWVESQEGKGSEFSFFLPYSTN